VQVIHSPVGEEIPRPIVKRSSVAEGTANAEEQGAGVNGVTQDQCI